MRGLLCSGFGAFVTYVDNGAPYCSFAFKIDTAACLELRKVLDRNNPDHARFLGPADSKDSKEAKSGSSSSGSSAAQSGKRKRNQKPKVKAQRRSTRNTKVKKEGEHSKQHMDLDEDNGSERQLSASSSSASSSSSSQSEHAPIDLEVLEERSKKRAAREWEVICDLSQDDGEIQVRRFARFNSLCCAAPQWTKRKKPKVAPSSSDVIALDDDEDE